MAWWRTTLPSWTSSRDEDRPACIYTYLYAQDDLKANYRTRLMPYGGQKALHRSQVYVRLERYYAEDSAILTVKDDSGNVVQATDMFGRPIFKHKAGQLQPLFAACHQRQRRRNGLRARRIHQRALSGQGDRVSNQEELKAIIDEVYGGNRAST